MGRPSRYTKEFKAQAVDLVNNTDRTQSDVAPVLLTRFAGMVMP